MVNNTLHNKISEQTKGHKKPYRVLSLDGGGMRGLYTASILQSLVNRFSRPNNINNKDIGKGFDLIVGTSTGSILACGLATGISISKLIEFYRNNGKNIFTDPFPSKGWKKFYWILKNFCKPANSNKILTEELQKIFENKTIAQIYDERQIGLCITSVNLIDHSPRVFKTPHNPDKNADNKRLLKDVCLASSAAPILFPIAQALNPENNTHEYFADGGLWANNPILVALIEAIICSEKNQKIEIISIGTCSLPTGQAVGNTNRGLWGWKFGIAPMELSMDVQAKANCFITDFLCSQFKGLGKEITIYRLKQTAPSSEQGKFLSMDQASEKSCSTLIQLGKKDADEIYGETMRTNENNELKNVFTNLPDIKGGSNHG